MAAFFEKSVYVRVRRNQYHVRHIESGREGTFDADPPFTGTRLLIAQFRQAEKLLKRAIAEVTGSGIFSVGPRVLIQPLEMIDGGLSEIEDRVFHEVAVGAGATKTVVWVGAQLTDAEVRAKLSGK